MCAVLVGGRMVQRQFGDAATLLNLGHTPTSPLQNRYRFMQQTRHEGWIHTSIVILSPRDGGYGFAVKRSSFPPISFVELPGRKTKFKHF